jgi:hypothetical protein
MRPSPLFNNCVTNPRTVCLAFDADANGSGARRMNEPTSVR